MFAPSTYLTKLSYATMTRQCQPMEDLDDRITQPEQHSVEMGLRD